MAQPSDNPASGRFTAPEDPLPGTPPDEALAALLDRYGPRVYSLALRFCGNPQNAADVVQDTFLGAYRSWPAFRGESSIPTWLYRIASRACQRFHRSETRQSAHAVPLETALPASGPVPDLRAGPTPLEEAERAEALRALERAVAELPESYRIPIVLKEIAGLSVAETAAVLDMKEATVKTRLHRARLALYDALAETVKTRQAPPPAYEERVCIDLLNAKQDALDRGAPFPQLDQITCERCRAVFQTLDLSVDLCRAAADESLPEGLRERVLGAASKEP